MAWMVMEVSLLSTLPSSPALSKFNAERGLVFLVDEGGKPGFLVLQCGEIGFRSRMGEIGADQEPARAQQSAQILEQRPRRRETVEKRHVVAGIEPAHHLAEVALMHDDVAGHAMGLDLLARELHVVAVALDGIDLLL